MARDISTEIAIDAPPACVWQVLTDFAAYPQWNPFVRTISGAARVGARLDVVLGPEGKSPLRFKPRVLVATPDRELRWLGSLPLPGLFNGEHRFVLHPADAGTRFEHGERFSGLLVPLLAGMLRDTERGFQQFNEALKRRAEAGLS